MGLSFGLQPASPLGHDPFVILGQAAQTIPQTPIFILTMRTSLPAIGISLSAQA
jgi:hypothetical protein